MEEMKFPMEFSIFDFKGILYSLGNEVKDKNQLKELFRSTFDSKTIKKLAKIKIFLDPNFFFENDLVYNTSCIETMIAFMKGKKIKESAFTKFLDDRIADGTIESFFVSRLIDKATKKLESISKETFITYNQYLSKFIVNLKKINRKLENDDAVKVLLSLEDNEEERIKMEFKSTPSDSISNPTRINKYPLPVISNFISKFSISKIFSSEETLSKINFLSSKEFRELPFKSRDSNMISDRNELYFLSSIHNSGIATYLGQHYMEGMKKETIDLIFHQFDIVRFILKASDILKRDIEMNLVNLISVYFSIKSFPDEVLDERKKRIKEEVIYLISKSNLNDFTDPMNESFSFFSINYNNKYKIYPLLENYKEFLNTYKEKINKREDISEKEFEDAFDKVVEDFRERLKENDINIGVTVYGFYHEGTLTNKSKNPFIKNFRINFGILSKTLIPDLLNKGIDINELLQI